MCLGLSLLEALMDVNLFQCPFHKKQRAGLALAAGGLGTVHGMNASGQEAIILFDWCYLGTQKCARCCIIVIICAQSIDEACG